MLNRLDIGVRIDLSYEQASHVAAATGEAVIHVATATGEVVLDAGQTVVSAA